MFHFREKLSMSAGIMVAEADKRNRLMATF